MGLHKNKYDWGQFHTLWITNWNQSLHTQPKDTAGAPRKLCADVCAVSTLYNSMKIVLNTSISWLNIMVCCSSPSAVNCTRKLILFAIRPAQPWHAPGFGISIYTRSTREDPAGWHGVSEFYEAPKNGNPQPRINGSGGIWWTWTISCIATTRWCAATRRVL